LSSGSIAPFQPAVTVSIAASTTSANAPVSGAGEAMLITNTTTSLAYVSFGADATLSASNAATPVLPASHILLRCGPLVSYCAVVLASGTGTVIFTRGDGAST
jgi:hypothetical protein